MSVDSRDTSFDYSQTNHSLLSSPKKSPIKGSRRDGLTAEELKIKLLQTVKNKGIFDSMKSQLRNKLVLELNPNIDQIKSRATQESQIHKSRSNLALSTINCLLINHLKAQEYDYTLSVFMPECGINLNDVYSLEDILHILKISDKSKLYLELINNQAIKTKGLLWYLVNYFCSRYVSNDASTQTDYDGVHNIASNLGMKLQHVDQMYSDKSDFFNNKLSFEDKVVAYQKKLDEKSKMELNQKIAEFKEIELARMRAEERQKMRQEVQSFRQDLENNYGKRNALINQREQALEEQFKQKKELEEREIYIQRQHLLDEIKQLREQEAQFKRTVEAQTKFMQIDSSKYEKIEEDLKKREEKLRLNQAELEARIRDEREKIKLDLERSYAQRQFILESIEAKNKQDASQNEMEKSHLDRIRHQYQIQQIRINEMDLELQKTFGESVCLRQENELLKEKLSHCMDYDFIVQENRMLKQKLEISKELIGEKHLSSRRAKSILSSREVPQRKRSVTFEDQGTSVPKLNLKNEDLSVMDTEVAADDVFDDKSRQSCHDEGEKILDDAMDRLDIKDKLEDHALLNEELRDLYEMQIYEQRKLYEVITDVKKDVEFLQHGLKSCEEILPAKMENLDLNFLECTKDRLRYLENENEKIEKNYRDYQFKVKSKYYPINDDQTREIRIVGKEKREFDFGDLEKFLQSTIKADLKAKELRLELNQEIERVDSEKKKKETRQVDFSKIEHLIRDNGVPDLDVVRKNLEKEQDELRNFQLRSKSELLVDRNSFLSDDESPRGARLSNRTSPVEEDAKSVSKSEASTRRSSPVKNFALNDYVQMFDKKEEKISEDLSELEVKKTRIKIEYSDSSSESIKSDHEKSSSSEHKHVESKLNEDDDDDFGW
ncbi:Oral-facial-digital syndrome 1 [Brachionus plicatilis]|uniref:Oral-facial-digital syndrome 1 n=1 Tax=Brachionus plicatilis TaxID=10195 RepID=A0A3M7SG96_BRAPC|nr:Oral-facial-digital syndrome 1 [Brachionus plicatilis]